MKIRIIPCLDVDGGRVVKGINFIDLIDAGDPVEQAKIYSENGADEITFLDITATHERRNPMIDIIEKTAYQCFVPLTVGGGVRGISDMDKFLSVGADKISLNSAAINNPGLINEGAKKFGNQCIVVAIDAKKVKDAWNVFINGGRVNTNLNAITWAKEVEDLGAGEILLTSMDRDGTKAGFDLDLTKVIVAKLSSKTCSNRSSSETFVFTLSIPFFTSYSFKVINLGERSISARNFPNSSYVHSTVITYGDL